MLDEQTADVPTHLILKSSGVLAVVSLLTLLLSFLREVVIAARLGAGRDVDAYLVAALYPSLLGSALASTITSTLVPVYQRASVGGEESRDEYVSAMWTASLLGIVGLTVLLGLAIRPLLQLAAPGFAANERGLALRMALILLPAGVCSGLVGFQSAVLNARKIFGLPALANSLSATGVILTVWVTGAKAGVLAIAYGSVLGAAAGLVLVSVLSIRTGVRLRLVRQFWTPLVKRTAVHAAPLLVGAAATFATVAVDRSMASSLAPGTIASLGYADKVVKIPETILMGAIPVVLLPYLSESASGGKSRALASVSTLGLTSMIILLLPVTAFCVALSHPLVEILFQRGKFDPAATQRTATALSGYALGLAFNGMGYVFPRILLALERSRVVALLGLGNVLLKIAYNLLLIPHFGHGGIALGTSLMYATTDVLFVVALAQYGVRLDTKAVISSFAVGIGFGAVVASAAIGAKLAHLDAFSQIAITAASGLAVAFLGYRLGALRALVLPHRSEA